MGSKFLTIFLMFILLGSMPVYAVIQDRGISVKPTVATNDEVISELANLDKTISALSTKLPQLIESRFNYYESIQRQNDIKMIIGNFGAFLIALMIYALIRNKNDRNKERALTRSEQILTNIETRIEDLESSDEVTVVVEPLANEVVVVEPKHKEKVDDNIVPEEKLEFFHISEETKDSNMPDPPKPVEEKMGLSAVELFEKYYSDEEMNPLDVYCDMCVKKMIDGSFKDACKPCRTKITNLIELQRQEAQLIKNQLSINFCKNCMKQVQRGGLQRGFKLCKSCNSLISPKPKDQVIDELKDKEVDEVLEVTKPNPKQEKVEGKQMLTDEEIIKQEYKRKKKTDNDLGIDML